MGDPVGTGGYLMGTGFLLAMIVVPYLAWDWSSEEWRYPKTAGLVLWINGLLIGIALGMGPD
jgi:hypothetical protein